MKNITLALTTMFMLMSFSACGKAEESVSENNSQNITEAVTTEHPAETNEQKEDESAVAGTVKNETSKAEAESPESDDGNIAAVVYFSATGTTAEIAEMIAEEADADIFEIIPKEPYSSDDLNYNGDCRANREQNDDSARPEIENDLSAVEDYDVIYLGYPIWWGTNPKIIQTFCEGYDISDAEIYTFCTSGSSGIDISISNLKDNYSLNIIDGKRLNDATAGDIHEWISSHN